jgi:3-methylcrotonyl-CoA carboxylase alpha subunit
MPAVLPSAAALADAAAALAGVGAFRGFRLNAAPCRTARLLVGGTAVEVDFADADSAESAVDRLLVSEEGQTWDVTPFRAIGGGAGAAADGAILSPMPGRIIAVEVAERDAVTAGQRLVTLEAMKMEHSLTAPFDGIVAELPATSGDQVSEGALLVRIARVDPGPVDTKAEDKG